MRMKNRMENIITKFKSFLLIIIPHYLKNNKLSYSKNTYMQQPSIKFQGKIYIIYLKLIKFISLLFV